MELNDPNPGPNEQFGQNYVVVNGTHAVVTDANDSGGFGAAYIFDVAPGSPTQGQLLSNIVGSTGTDQVGSGGITALSTGNVIISQPELEQRGTLLARWCAHVRRDERRHARRSPRAAASCPRATASSAVRPNAAVATARSTSSCRARASPLVNPGWNLGAGAVTFGDAFAGMPVGVLSNANSIVRDKRSDQIGVGRRDHGRLRQRRRDHEPSLEQLARSGDVRADDRAPGHAGRRHDRADRRHDGRRHRRATASRAHSRHSSSACGGVTPPANGNYFVSSPGYSGAGGTETAAGALSWVNGANGIAFGESLRGAVVSGANSIRGNVNDQVGSGGITQLFGAATGNVVISSPNWGGGSARPRG